MAISCPACGKENAEAAFECVRCRAPLRDEPEHPHPQPDEAHPEPAAHDASLHEEQAHPAPHAAALADSLGEVCRRCETYNEPGQKRCTTCGYELVAEAQQAATASPAHADEQTPPQGFAPIQGEPDGRSPSDTPPDGSASVHDELFGLVLSSEEAAEAGSSNNGHPAEAGRRALPPDATPREGLAPVVVAQAAQPPHPLAEKAFSQAAVDLATAALTGAVPRRPPPRTSEPPPEAAAATEPKSCANCGSVNPPAARFCLDCGTPFKRAAPPPPALQREPQPPPRIEPFRVVEPIRVVEPVKPLARAVEVPPSIHVELGPEDGLPEEPAAHEVPHEGLHEEPTPHLAHAEEFETDSTAEQKAVEVDAETLRALAQAVPEHPAEDLSEPQHLEAADEAAAFEEQPAGQEAQAFEEGAGVLDAAELPEAPPEYAEEAPPPFHASVVIERGAHAGTAIVLEHLETALGGPGAAIDLGDDPHLAAHVATLLFAEDRLLLRDEGTSNGVFVKVREAAAIEPGDHFIAGERLLRFDGPCELPEDPAGDTPFLGAPRPPGPATVRITEVLAGGRTGRTCHRSGPAIAVGRSGCDLNFPADSLLSAKHAEIRLAEDGSATLVDLGASGSGLFLRMRSRGLHEVQQGDLLQLGDQAVRVEVG